MACGGFHNTRSRQERALLGCAETSTGEDARTYINAGNGVFC
jgi:hypothetical protein